VSHRSLILDSAKELFALEGFGATSVQDVADRAGVSKATVLYHVSTKEDLLDQALAPTLDRFEALVADLSGSELMDNHDQRAMFVDRFVEFLLADRLGVHIIVTHAHLHKTIPALGRATGLMARLAEVIDRSSRSDFDALRFGIALSGAAYALVSEKMLGIEKLDSDGLADGLRAVLLEFMSPIVGAETDR
jgi:AcrR family transcriptional regulator